MSQANWAEATARKLLAKPLPRRWAHTQGVAATARGLAAVLGLDADLVTAAAWLHDIGYAPDVAATGFHPLDGARHLRDNEGASAMLCRLVAHHSCAINEAIERGLACDLAAEFPPARRDLADALIYCDMTTSPDGHRLPVARRLAEIRSRYGPGHLVSRSITRSAPELTSAVGRVTDKLAACSPRATPAPDHAVTAGAVAQPM
jgi:putative nucleotidyltransferase with HDIG domain